MSMAAWLNKLTMGPIPIIENARERNPDIIAKEARGRSMRFKRIPLISNLGSPGDSVARGFLAAVRLR